MASAPIEVVLMQTNAILTIINHAVADHKDVFLVTCLGPVSWYAHQKQTVGESGMRSADAVRVRVPRGAPEKEYLPEVDWRALPPEKRADFWTIQKGDLIVCGKIKESVQSTAQIKDAYGSNAAVVTGYADNRRGSAAMQHWRIDGA
jgi:hypothetical protein